MRFEIQAASVAKEINRINQDSIMIDKYIVSTSELPNFETKFQLDNNKVVVGVADGMGGEVFGELASEIVTKTISNNVKRIKKNKAAINDSKLVFNEIWNAINQNIVSEFKGNKGGSTLSLLYISNEKYISINAGDSPIYKISKGVRSIFEEQTVAGKNANRCSRKTNSRASNILVHCVNGTNSFDETHIECGDIKEGDIFIICSDGLIKGLTTRKIKNIIKNEYKTENNIAKKLVDLAKRNGSNDDISCIFIKIMED